MILGTAAFALAFNQGQELPKPAELQPGEVVRLFERTMSRRGTFENILVLTPNKAFWKNGDVRNWAMLTSYQQAQLKAILHAEPEGLRSKKRPNPMWPSAYDGSDQWLTYRVGRVVKRWGNNEYEYPLSNCSFTAFLDGIKLQLSESSK